MRGAENVDDDDVLRFAKKKSLKREERGGDPNSLEITFCEIGGRVREEWQGLKGRPILSRRPGVGRKPMRWVISANPPGDISLVRTGRIALWSYLQVERMASRKCRR